jgi:DNA mismatch repair ATPase MutS
MKECFDIERCLQRISVYKGGPRDLASVASTLEEIKEIRKLILAGNLKKIRGGRYSFLYQVIRRDTQFPSTSKRG